MLSISLPTLEHTQTFGLHLAQAIISYPVEAIYLYGPLGSGKTTLTQALVRALPGSDNAEVASPSFTIFHEYPTHPKVVHCDLYRCQAAVPDELLELFEDGAHLAIVEWPEFLPTYYHAREYLDISINACEKNRVLTIKPFGINAKRLCDKLTQIIRPSSISENAF